MSLNLLDNLILLTPKLVTEGPTTVDRTVDFFKGVNMKNLFDAFFVLLLLYGIYEIVIKNILLRIMKSNAVNKGRQYAAQQIIKYVFFILGTILILDNFGIDITALLLGSAALLVGVGIGLQKTFNDLISGLILLFEGTISVGDIVNVHGMVATVSKIGIRTSTVETRDNIKMIIPNSQFIEEDVVNWTHDNKIARFDVKVGVAYGSDLDLVKKCLLEVTKKNPNILDSPPASVLFTNFGDSALDFELQFWSKNFWNIEGTKSDIRFSIEKTFRENDIEIPFPQRDLHIKSTGLPTITKGPVGFGNRN